MHEILKRALDEALTAAYAGEIPVGAEEVAFSEGFEREMRGLIRKTDRPIQKYIPILTAAACAVIAIGCAVLLPRLLSNPVPIESNEDSTATVTSSAPIDEPAESSSTAGTTPDEPHEIQDENPGAAGGVSDDKEDTTKWDDEDGDVAGENGVPAVTGSSVSMPDPYPQDPNDFPATVIPDSEETTTNDKDDDTVDEDDQSDDTVEEDIEVEDDDAESDVVDEDTEVDDEDDDGENIIIDDSDDDDVSYDDDSDDDAAYDDSDDDDVSYDDDSDDDTAYDDSDDDDMDIDDDEAVDESTLPPIAKRASLNGEVQALLGCSLADSYLHKGNVRMGELYDLPIIEGISPETYRDPALAELIGAAKYIGGEPEEIGTAIFFGNIGKEAPVIKPAYESDQSDRNRYDEIYFGEDSWVDDEEEVINEPAKTVYLEIWQNGIVSVRMEGYRGAAYYRLNDEALKKLTARIEARFKVSEPETVGELSEQIGSAEDYAQVYVSISRYYDCTMYGALSDGSFLADLLEKYKDEKLLEPEGQHGDIPIQIGLTSRKTLQIVFFDFYVDGTVIVSGRKAFTVDKAELRAILSEYCRQKNLPAPVFYETLGEYLKDKNFTTLTEARFETKGFDKDLHLVGDNAEIRALIEKYAVKSAFLPDAMNIVFAETDHIELQLESWSIPMRITRDRIVVGGYSGRIFEAPDGLYDKLYAIISEKGESPYAEQDEDYYDDDVADDEEIVEDVEE